MTYGTDQGLTDYLASMDLTLPANAPSLSALRQIGSNYIDAAYEYALQCSKRTGGLTQELAWPRTGHYVSGELIPDDLIPPQWIAASYRAAYLAATVTGWGLSTSDQSRIVKRQKVDSIEREFFDASTADMTQAAPGMTSDATINGMVAALLCDGAAGRRKQPFFIVV